MKWIVSWLRTLIQGVECHKCHEREHIKPDSCGQGHHCHSKECGGYTRV